MTAHATFKLSVIAAALMTVYGPVLAADGDDAVRVLAAPDSKLSAGIGNLSGDRQQLGKYDDLNKRDTFPMFDADVRMRNETSGTWTTLTTRNLGRQNGEFNVGYEQQGNWGVALDYSQTPSNDPRTYMTGVRGIGSNTLTYGTVGGSLSAVSATATAAARTAAQTGLFSATNEVHLGTRRDSARLDISKVFSPEITFNFSFRNEDKKGTQLWGRGSNPEFAVQPINWNTKQADATLSYATRKFQLAGGISASWFRNANSFVDTIGATAYNNPNVANNTLGHTFLSLPLDNKAYNFFLDGGYSFTRNTHGSFKMSKSRSTQSDDLGAMTSAIRAAGGTGTATASATAPSSLNGRVDNTTWNLAITSKLMDKLNVSAKYDYNQRKDETPVQIIGPTAVAGGQTNNPHGFKKDSLKLEAIYRLPQGYSLIGGFEDERREHALAFANDGAFEGTVKMRAKTDESTWRLQLRRTMSETVNGSVAYLNSKRRGSSWINPATEVVAGNLLSPGGGVAPYVDVTATTVPWTNPFAFADRNRNKLRLMADWSPADKVSLQFNYENSKDDYTPANAGMQKGTGELFSLDANIALANDWQLNGWLSQDISKAHHRGITYDPRTTGGLVNGTTGVALATLPGSVGWLCSSANAGANQCTTDLVWDMNMKDVGNTIGFNLKGKATAKLVVGANLQWTQTKSQYPTSSNVPDYNTGANGAATGNRSQQGLPDITTTTTKIGLFGEYALEKNTDLRIDVIHTRYKSDDWNYMEWNAAGTALIPLTMMDGTVISAKQNQSSVFVGARVNYKFQ